MSGGKGYYKKILLALIKVTMITMVQIMMMVGRKMYYLKNPVLALLSETLTR